VNCLTIHRLGLGLGNPNLDTHTNTIAISENLRGQGLLQNEAHTMQFWCCLAFGVTTSLWTAEVKG